MNRGNDIGAFASVLSIVLARSLAAAWGKEGGDVGEDTAEVERQGSGALVRNTGHAAGSNVTTRRKPIAAHTAGVTGRLL